MSGRIRYHINTTNGKAGVKPKKRIQSDAEKIFVLVNDALSGEPTVTDFSMSQV
jgi:ATP-dependent DNA helicase HFM1/MER3